MASSLLPGEPSLRERMTGGVFWLSFQSGLTRLLGALQAAALAWLLDSSDWGSVGLALTVSAFLQLLCDPGIESVLVSRTHGIRHWVTPAYWMGLCLGVVGAVGMLAAAPAAAWAYGEPGVMGLVCVMALSAPTNALLVVPNALLRSQLRFRELALLAFVMRLVTVSLTIATAAAGWGAYSFVAPVPIASGVTAALAWRFARPTIHPTFQFRRWRYLVRASSQLGATRILQTLVAQGAYVVLGLAGFSLSAIGLYYFAYSMSAQATQLMSSSVIHAVFPALTKLSSDPPRQVGATRRAARILAVVIVPFCLAQVVLGASLFRICFPPDKQDALASFQILTLAVILNAPAWPASSLLMAQSRFRELLVLWLRWTAVYVVLVSAAAWGAGNVNWVAAAVAVWHAASAVAIFRLAVRGHGTGGVIREVTPPLIAGVAALIAAAILVRATAQGLMADLLDLTLGGSLFAMVYTVTLAWIAPHLLADTLDQLRLRGLANRVRRGTHSSNHRAS
ncbi:Lipopolysaccharide biosynthesis protein WzxC [Pirellulimonas nuda]|uniref:Lipopolysaccharide biosynthesis protein WzxC n=1 Tax=Pirellulimonas nuda TaxID=2528009 RepID=A0A518D704_9BACT|nr:oligosaccharide flippase family protein [Pirellulimonas nuda]QDU87235.1 Lipopolysaccharide biosynthesis protein WzxC [Pirellulimonas nuda]